MDFFSLIALFTAFSIMMSIEFVLYLIDHNKPTDKIEIDVTNPI